MEINSESEAELIPHEISEAAKTATYELLPLKSRERYELVYNLFQKWSNDKKVHTINEEVILAYLMEKSKILKPSSLWSNYSMLKSTINIKNNIDISRYPKVIAFLKRKSVGYKPKKSRVLNKEEIDKFLSEAGDNIYLVTKVALIIGLAGACRREEFCKMSLDDIEDKINMLVIKIPDSKTNMERTFVVIGENNISLYRKYLSLRPANTPHRRLFVYYKNGKCTTQPIGIHTFGNIACKIAEFLKLPHPKEYTGHCLRRSSATLLADGGGSITNLKRHGGWKSTSVAEGYVENSLRNKIHIASQIEKGRNEINISKTSTNTDTSNNTNFNTATSVNIPNNINISNCYNCVINIHK